MGLMKSELPSRGFWVFSTCVTGATVAAGFLIATYAMENAANTEGVPDGQSMGVSLFGPLYILTFLFVVLLYHALIWKRFVLKGVERIAATNELYSTQINFAKLMNRVCCAIICMDAFVLFIVARIHSS